MRSINTLIERSPSTERPFLSAPLKTAYDGDLMFPRSTENSVYVLANFVMTLDGRVSYHIPGKSGGGEISGFNDEDRYVMGLLRSLADAVLFGSGTLHGDPGHVRIAEFICPSFQDEFRSFRQTVLKKPVYPLNVIITGSGRIDLDEPTFHTSGLSTLIITTAGGYERLRRDHGRSLAATTVRTTGDKEERVSPRAALRILHDEFAVEHLLHEGGPTLLGQFLAHDLVDEVFLTLSPQVAGQDETHRRPGMVEGWLFSPDTAPWYDLISLKMARSHLYLRYRTRRPVPNSGIVGSG